MAEDQEKCPSMDLNRNVEFNPDEQKYSSITMELDCAIPVKEGSFKGKTKDGRSYTNNWHLWFGKVDKKKVYWKDEKREESDFSGKVLFFPPDLLNEQLIELCDGNKGVSVEITKVMVPGKKGMTTPYKAKKVDGVSPSTSNLSKDELAFVEDLKKLKVEEGLNINEQTAMTMAENDYGIKLERAKEIYKLV